MSSEHNKRGKYGLLLRSQDDTKFDEYIIIGEFRDMEQHKPILPIVVSDSEVKNARMRQMVVTLRRNQPVIFLETEFAKKLISGRSKSNVFLLWHELGHLVLNHGKRYKNQEELRNARVNAIKSGTVCDIEREADAFAAQKVGVAAGIAALRKLQKERYEFDVEHHQEISQQAVLAYNEFEYRINVLQDLASTKRF